MRASTSGAERRLLLGSMLLRQSSRLGGTRRPPLEDSLSAIDAAAAAGAAGPRLLARRGRAKELQEQGVGVADLADARRLNPRLLLLQGQ